MKKITIIPLLILTIVFSSCNFNLNLGQENGNGNVVTQTKEVENFKAIKASNGLDVYLTEGKAQKVIIEADENLQELIEVISENGTLKIRTKKNIGNSKSKKVHVTYTQLESIDASSGADVLGNSVIKNELLSVSSSSGADVELEVFTKELFADASSGADLKLSGKATRFIADASSGSDIKAKGLETISCKAEASSGADIEVNVRDRMEGRASSGGDIKYYGNPADVSKNDSSSGSIRKM